MVVCVCVCVDRQTNKETHKQTVNDICLSACGHNNLKAKHQIFRHDSWLMLLVCFLGLQDKTRTSATEIVEISRFFALCSRPPSWTCSMHVWTTHKKYLTVFTGVQYLAEIDAVVQIMCKFLGQIIYA